VEDIALVQEGEAEEVQVVVVVEEAVVEDGNKYEIRYLIY
jgi:hypothetical protein